MACGSWTVLGTQEWIFVWMEEWNTDQLKVEMLQQAGALNNVLKKINVTTEAKICMYNERVI